MGIRGAGTEGVSHAPGQNVYNPRCQPGESGCPSSFCPNGALQSRAVSLYRRLTPVVIDIALLQSGDPTLF